MASIDLRRSLSNFPPDTFRIFFGPLGNSF
jgi:hypothetical protein